MIQETIYVKKENDKDGFIIIILQKENLDQKFHCTTVQTKQQAIIFLNQQNFRFIELRSLLPLNH